LVKQNKAIGILFFSFTYLTIGILILINIPYDLNNNSHLNYLTLTLAYFIVSGVLLISYIITPLDIFEPLPFATLLYLMIFSIVPIINIINNETLFFGVDVMEGTKKATWIFVFSYLAFVLGYYLQKKRPNLRNKISSVAIPEELIKTICTVSLIIWLVCFMLSLFYLMASGKSLTYILTIGAIGEVNISKESDTPLGFISMFSYSLIPAWMYINAYSKNMKLKRILFVLTLIIFIVRGFRFIIVIMLLAPILFYYIKNKKRPKAFAIITLLIAIMFMIGLLGFIRGDVRLGNDIQWNSFDLSFILDAVKGNFNIYQPFYGMVQVIPEKFDYSYGSQMFIYTLIMFIPRAFWPNKPYSDLGEILTISVSSYASRAGIAFPNIGEFYLEFGVIGCIVFMFFFGKVCGWLKLLYKSDLANTHTIIAYSILLPTLMQIIIRGYTPSNFYLVLFLMIPLIIIRHIILRKLGDKDGY
jgi:oligosaccharide repeat unit polymerase